MGKEKKEEESDKKITQVEELPGIGPASADKLFAAGFKDLMSIATAADSALMEATGIGTSVAKKIIAVARVNCNLAGFITGNEMMERHEKILKLDTGSDALNKLLGGGIDTGSITEAHGKWSSSKTQLAHMLCVSIHKLPNNAEAVFIDTESCFKAVRIKEIASARGLDPDKILKQIKVARAYSFDHQILLAEKVKDLIDEGHNIKLIVIDSIIAHARTELCGRAHLAERQQKLGRHLATLAKLADTHNLCVFITNQVMSNPGQLFGDPIQAVGGNIVGHVVSSRIYLRRGKKGSRVAKLVDSVYLPDGECAYLVTEKGIEDL